MTERIDSAVYECLHWADKADPPPALDTEALSFLLHAHADAGACDPGDWCTADVYDVADAARGWDGTKKPEDLRQTWLTWCDYLVDQGELRAGQSPRELRAAIAGADLDPRAPLPPGAAAEEGTSEAVLLLLERLGADDGGEPPPTAPVVPGLPQDLDAAAKRCLPLAEAARLTVWVDKGRALCPHSDQDALPAPDTAEAAADLGLRQEEVGATVTTARDAGLLHTTYTRVLPGRTARDWADGVPGAAADAWADALLTMAGQPRTAPFLVLTDLFVSGRPRTPAGLADTYGSALVPDAAPHDRAPDPHTQASTLLAALAGLGAVESAGADSSFRITGLGDHFMVRQLRRSGAEVPVLDPLPQLAADQVLALMDTGRPVDTDGLLERWAALHDPQRAARELLEASTALEHWHRRQRVAAFLTDYCPAELPEVLPLYVHHPVLGGWARQLRDGPDLAPASHQVVWLELDRYAILLESGQPLPSRDRERLTEHAEQFTRAVWLSGHPLAETVLDLLTDGALGPDLAEASRRVRPTRATSR